MISREGFLGRLNSVVGGTSKNETVDQSDCFIFQKGSVATFNDEVACSVKSMVDSKISCAVKAAKLLDLIGKLPDEEIDVSVTDSEMLIAGKNRKAGIRIEREVVSHAASIERPDQWVALDPNFGEAVGIVQQCAGEDQSQFAASCVHVCPDWLESCDNIQLCRWSMKTGVSGPVLVRKHAIRHVTPLGVTEMSETEAWLHFRNQDGLVMSCRKYVESFPDLASVFDVDGVKVCLPKGLVEAADRAQVFSQENSDSLVQVDLRPGRVSVVGQGVTGWFKEKRKVDYKGDALTFLIAPKILMDIVEKHNECVISATRLMVDTGSYRYVSCLFNPEEPKTKSDEGDD